MICKLCKQNKLITIIKVNIQDIIKDNIKDNVSKNSKDNFKDNFKEKDKLGCAGVKLLVVLEFSKGLSYVRLVRLE